MRRYLFPILVLVTSHLQAQLKKAQNIEDDFKPAYTAGIAAGLNNISGLEFDMTFKDRNGGTSKSTFSFIAGYSSRLAGFSPDYDTTGTKTSRWVHGIGAGVVMTNFIEKLNDGPFWAVGITGSMFFKKPTFIDDTGHVITESTNLKSFAVFAELGYQLKFGNKYYIRPAFGGGIMGSPFQSTSASDINGPFITAGCSFLLKM